MNQIAPPPLQTIVDSTSRARLSYQSVQAITAAIDGFAFILAGALGFLSYQYYLSGEFMNGDDGLDVGFAAGVFFVTLARARGLYQIQVVFSPQGYFKKLYVILSLTFFTLISLMFLLKVGAQYSRGSVLAFGLFAVAFLTAGRLGWARFCAMGVRKGTIAGRRVVVVGEASELERLAPPDLLELGLAEVARIGVIQSDSGKGLSQKGRGQIAGAVALARELRASEFVLMLPWGHERLLAEVGALLRPSALSVKLLPDFAIRSVVSYSGRGGFDPALAIEIQRQPLSRWDRLSKRAIDLSLSLGAVALLSPFLLATALAIRLDSRGPAMFRQRRVGFDNREFVIFKFRTMTALEDGAEVSQARRNDARVTRLGRLLRRSSIDELPQLFNVIRGDMSLVGPRPHAVAHHDQFGGAIASYALRHHVKPGLTGMAQVRGFRGETSQLAQMERRVELDIWYINNWSLALDLAIMARTCLVLLRQDVY